MKKHADRKLRPMWCVLAFALGFLGAWVVETHVREARNKEWVDKQRTARERDKAARRRIKKNRARADALRKQLALPAGGR